LGDAEDSDETIGETGVEVLLVLGEDEGCASNLGWELVLLSSVLLDGNFVSVDESLVWEIIDLDTGIGTNNEPVIFGGEKNNVNWGFGIDVFEMLSFNQVPDVNMTVFGS
jgi:endonuclease/exonuclease/phosphatase (EEP) superfamily protein YafD